jgi:DNA-binding Lrp family transcriptional regulator
MQRTRIYTRTTKPTLSLDNIDLKIINSLTIDSRIPYRTMASTVGITPNAIKSRVNKMLERKIIQNFIVYVNPAIFGYEKKCLLTVRHINKRTKEEDIIKRLSLLGEVLAYGKQLGLTSMFLIAVKPEVEDKFELMTDLLKPAIVEYRFVTQLPPSMNLTDSDLKIIRSLLSNARMEVGDIAKESSISARTVTRRLEKMRENHVIKFSTIIDMSSMQLVGYIEFAVIINVDKSLHAYILKRIYRELQEYLKFCDENQTEVILAAFFCTNITTLDSILTKIESFEGVEHAEVFIMTKIVFYQEWLKQEINKSLRSEVKVAPSSKIYITNKDIYL